MATGAEHCVIRPENLRAPLKVLLTAHRLLFQPEKYRMKVGPGPDIGATLLDRACRLVLRHNDAVRSGRVGLQVFPCGFAGRVRKCDGTGRLDSRSNREARSCAATHRVPSRVDFVQQRAD
jgi:hypothetical protein